MDGPDHQSAATRWLHLAERISVCGRLLRAGLDRRMEACQLSPSQFSILWACYAAQGGAGQSALADQLAVSPAHVSGLVEQLRARRLLAARRPASDRRRQLWHLTPAGRAMVETLLVELRDWAEGLERQVPHSASRVLRHLVDQLTGAIQTGEATTAPALGRKGVA